HLDLVAVAGQGDLPAHGSRGLLTTALVRPEGTVDVVESRNPSLETEVLEVILAELLHPELLPPVALLGVRGVRVLLPQGRDLRPLLQVHRIDARARREEEPLDAGCAGGLED